MTAKRNFNYECVSNYLTCGYLTENGLVGLELMSCISKTENLTIYILFSFVHAKCRSIMKSIISLQNCKFKICNYCTYNCINIDCAMKTNCSLSCIYSKIIATITDQSIFLLC